MNILITIGVLLLVMGLVFLQAWALVRFNRDLPPSSCTGNCNQGRNCTCANSERGDA